MTTRVENVTFSTYFNGLVGLNARLSENIRRKIRIGTPDLPECVRERLQRMEVPIVLDDVNKVRQLQYLSSGVDHFESGSRNHHNLLR